MKEPKNVTPGHSTSRQDSQKSKKVYEKPRVIYQAPLEAMAAVCTGQFGKATGQCTVANS